MTDNNREIVPFDLDEDAAKSLYDLAIMRYGTERIAEDFEAMLANGDDMATAFAGAFVSPVMEELVKTGMENDPVYQASLVIKQT